MLLIGEFAIANSDSELTEMLLRFDEDEDCKTLIVIDAYNRIENIKGLCHEADLGCFVTWLQPGYRHTDTEKGVYLIEQFDLATQDSLREHWSLLVFYN